MNFEERVYDLVFKSSKFKKYNNQINFVDRRQRFEKARLHLDLSFNSSPLNSYLLSIRKLDLNPKIMLLDRVFGKLNIIYLITIVKFSLNDKNDLPRILLSIAKYGLMWLDKKLIFIGSKEPKSQKAYFLITDHPINQLYQMRNLIANFTQLPHIPIISLRLSLLFSGVAEGFTKSTNDIIVKLIADVKSDDNEYLLADGSGFISLDLVENLPYPVSHGRKTNTTIIISSQATIKSQPAVFQVRIVCPSLGLFKGTLVVHPGISNMLILRESMRKAPPAKKFTKTELHVNDFINSSTNKNDDDNSSINKTFPVITNLNTNSNVIVDVVNTSSCPKKSSSTLNRHIIIMLHTIGIPYQIFEKMIRDHAEILSKMCSDRQAAINYCKNEYNTTIFSGDCLQSSTSYTNAIILDMLSAGHSITEPFIQGYLQHQCSIGIQNLCEARIPVHPAMFLMGIPDPTETLLSGEVYITLGGNHTNEFFPSGSTVLITRYPLLRPQALALMTVTTNHALEAWFNGRGAIVVFSCCHSLSQVEVMGGDFDGDLYFLCADPTILSALIATKVVKTETATQLLQIFDIECTASNPFFPHEYSEDANLTSQDDDAIYSDYYSIEFPIDDIPCITSKIECQSSTASTFTKNDFICGDSKYHSNELTTHNDEVMSHAMTMIGRPPSSLTPEEFEEALFWEFIVGSRYLTNSIGKYANEWLVAVDKFGPTSDTALALADRYDQSMISRKCGYPELGGPPHLLPPTTSYRNSSIDELPHFLLSNGTSSSSSSISKISSYQSKSILGRLYDLSRALTDSITFYSTANITTSDSSSRATSTATLSSSSSSCSPPDIVLLDLHMKINGSEDFLELAEKLLKSFLDDVRNLSEEVSGVSGGGTEETYHTTATASSSEEFDDVSAIGRGLMELIIRYQGIFEALVDILNDRLGMEKIHIKHYLASAFYEVTYLLGKNSISNNFSQTGWGTCRYFSRREALKIASKKLRVCWWICGSTLNQIKEGQNITLKSSSIPASVLQQQRQNRQVATVHSDQRYCDVFHNVIKDRSVLLEVNDRARNILLGVTERGLLQPSISFSFNRLKV